VALPTYVGSGTANSTTGASQAYGYHASTAVNDILLCVVEQNSVDAAPSTPAGWAVAGTVGTPTTTIATRCTVFWKRAVSGDLGGTVTVSNPGNHIGAQVHTLRGVATVGTPLTSVTSVSALSGSHTATGITTTNNDTLVAYCFAHGRGGVTSTAYYLNNYTSSGVTWTQRTAVNHTVGDGGGIALVTGPRTTPGATGNISFSLDTNTANNATFGTAQCAHVVIQLYPAAVTPSASRADVVAATAYDTGNDVAAQPDYATAVAAAYEAVIERPASFASGGVAAYNASIAMSTTAAVASALATARPGGAYFGAHESRRWRIPPEDRSWPVNRESRSWMIPPDRETNRVWKIPPKDDTYARPVPQ
jgi:hypothetical protein